MIVKLLLISCLVVVAGRPKMRGVIEPQGLLDDAEKLVQNHRSDLCTIIVVMDSTAIASYIFEEFRSRKEQWQALAIFNTNVEDKSTNSTYDLSKMISLARQMRQLSWCTMVMVVSRNPDFLVAFAERSLTGRLLVWTTRLLVVTRLGPRQLQTLLGAYWTYSMMNAVFFNSEGNAGHAWYDVYTYLPLSPDGSQMVKIAIWTPAQGFRYLSHVSFFQDKYDNFHGAMVNVTAKPYMPYWDEKKMRSPEGFWTIEYRGSDYRLLEAVAKVLNFTVQVLPTSSWTEVTNLVEERISLIAPIIHLVLPIRVERYDFTYTYENVHSSFAVAKPSLEPRWKSLYYPLANEVWMTLLVSLLLLPFLLSLFLRASYDGHGGKHVSVGALFQDTVGMLLGQNLPHRLCGSSSSTILVANWLLFTLILAVAYRGNLTAALTLPKFPRRPETLQEIVDTVEMVTIPAYGEQHRKFYSQSDSSLFQTLGRLMNPGPSLMEGLRMALVKKTCHLEGRKYLQYKIIEKFTEKDGSTRLYVNRESVYPGPSAWPIPHDAPYKAHLDRWIIAALEAGLYNKWVADLLMETKLKSQRQQRQRLATGYQEEELQAREVKDGPPVLTISHTQGAFIVLLLGFVLATFAFTRELNKVTPIIDHTNIKGKNSNLNVFQSDSVS